MAEYAERKISGNIKVEFFPDNLVIVQGMTRLSLSRDVVQNLLDEIIELSWCELPR